MSDIDKVKKLILEKEFPCFTDEDIQFYLDQNEGDVKGTVYQCLLIKAQDTTLNVSGLNTSDSSGYFRKLASMYTPKNTGILQSE
jgi:hypothetical protein